jgi:Delta carbonic anhydrase
MKVSVRSAFFIGTFTIIAAGGASAAKLCSNYGPQTPRDISSAAGSNARLFSLAPSAAKLNLCNIHFHANAEHKAPGFKVFAGKGEHGGFKCNDTATLSKAELAPAKHSACHGVKPGDTIEVHWVYSSCDVKPGKGLGSCLSDACANPDLRVEAQTFLVVNDPKAADFADFGYSGDVVHGLHQPKALPVNTGDPVVFRGSTTGPQFTDSQCSPLQVTWSVRPSCTKVDINSLDAWCAKNVFEEDHAHGVRQLVTAPELLAPIN